MAVLPSLLMIVDPDFPDNPKTVKLIRLLGEISTRMLLRMWGHCQARRSDKLGDAEDVAAICRYEGRTKTLLEALLACRWIDADPDRAGAYIAHGWSDKNQQWLRKVEGGKKRAQNGTRSEKGCLVSVGLPAIGLTSRQLASGVANQLASGEAGAVEWSGVEKDPLSSPKGGQTSIALSCLDAWAQCCAIFGRSKKNRARPSYRAEVALAGFAMRGVLPAPDEWELLQSFYFVALKDKERWHPRETCESLAENLEGELDKARSWRAESSAGAGTAKKMEPEPPGWREWLQQRYPGAEIPDSFWDLSPSLRQEFGKGEA